MCMGVDHRGRGRTSPPRIWSGNANASCPPQILPCFKISSTRLLKASAYRYKKERSVAFKIRQNAFSAPDPAGGAHDAPPEHLARKGTPFLYPAFRARHASPRIPARSTPMSSAVNGMATDIFCYTETEGNGNKKHSGRSP